MPVFVVLRRQDAYVDYFTEVEADTPQAAADFAYGDDGVVWREAGRTEYDASRVVALDDNGAEIDSTSRGKA